MAKLLAPDLAGGSQVLFPCFLQNPGDDRLGHAPVPQVGLQAQAAVMARAGMGQGLGEARIGEQALTLQVIQQNGDLVRVAVGSQLARQLDPAVFTPGQQVERPLSELQASAGTGAADFTPSFSRIWASISAAISGCSFRYSRALSLPWPIFSPW